MTDARGIDISHYQNPTPSLAGLSFAFVKATEGAHYTDPMYATHMANVKKAGLVSGAYHYASGTDSIALQVAHFLQVAGDVDLYALDTEHGTSIMSLAQMRAFATVFHATGKKLVGYASEDRYPVYGQDWRWVAHYGVAEPSIPYDFHQYRGSPLDLDRYHGTDAQLRARVHPTQPAAQYRAYFRPLAKVRVYKLGSRPGVDCIEKPWKDERWGLRPSSAPCEAPVRRPTCDGLSHALTVKVTGGKRFGGKTIWADAGGVTVRRVG